MSSDSDPAVIVGGPCADQLEVYRAEVERLLAENTQLRATRAAAYGAMRIQGDQLRAGRAE